MRGFENGGAPWNPKEPHFLHFALLSKRCTRRNNLKRGVIWERTLSRVQFWRQLNISPRPIHLQESIKEWLLKAAPESLMATMLFEFHVARDARDRYQFDERLFAYDGTVIIGDFMAARRFALRMNAVREADKNPQQAVRASDIYAMGLLDEVMHVMIDRYRQQTDPGVFARALAQLRQHLGDEAMAQTLRAFLQRFPPLAVYRGEMTEDAWLVGSSNGLSHEEMALEELAMLWIANQNPALKPYHNLFDDSSLAQTTAYLPTIQGLRGFFDKAPGFANTGKNLLDMLMEPIMASPDSLEGQLRYIREKWAPWLDELALKLLSSLDFIAEEHKPAFGGPGPTPSPDFSLLENEIENYTPDTNWMPRVVLLAKNTYVWLYQLSRQYGRPITSLDQIPEEELDAMAARGVTGLWLIGLWRRSRASQRIKQMMGNPEAVSSAYAVDDYLIADDFGGEPAIDILRQRAWQRGIRLASDMVPNHMAIDSRWVIEHPDRFLSLNSAPFPNYTFNGPDLCDDQRVAIYLEDHYYDKTDAAVVFKRLDAYTGDARYIYHGNDGTAMPWNDTAQLDYLNPETREAVIQTILHVARQFPIIRFDAAMTLAKRHIQRLWHPEPGQGGAIPSRAAFALSKADFDRLMPKEFWREVVDRIAAEAPDTLLLAEAFWLMEGYFVRTLGMHRVYNSAFMHMMRNEDNAKYRNQIKETLAFDPEILKRYVNFMTNPDEEPAVEQFGKGDKYFGVFTIMATVPGLPMIGHGQFEGFAEKYGMEYHRAYQDEQPDGDLLQRHMREITPLLKRRYLFADVQNFRLYDFETDAGVNENVLAYSNRYDQQRALVLYHNKFADARGHLRLSAPFKTGSDKHLRQESFGAGLALPEHPAAFVIFRELISGQEYIHNSAKLAHEGFYAELGAYQRLVYLDWRVVHDDDGRYAQAAAELNGRGVPSIDLYLKQQALRPLHTAFRALINGETLQAMLARRSPEAPLSPAQEALWDQKIEARLLALLQAARDFAASSETEEDDLDVTILLRRLKQLKSQNLKRKRSPEADAFLISQSPDLSHIASQILVELRAVLHFPRIIQNYPWPRSKKYREAATYLLTGLQDDGNAAWLTLIGYALLHRLGEALTSDAPVYHDWLLDAELSAALQETGLSAFSADKIATLVGILIDWQAWHQNKALMVRPYSARAARLLDALREDEAVRRYLGVNVYQDVEWYNKEAMETLLYSLFSIAVLEKMITPKDERQTAHSVMQCYDVIHSLAAAHTLSGYQLDKLRALA